MLFVVVVFVLFVGENEVRAGNCWMRRGSNLRCQVLYSTGLSRQECCRCSGSLGSYWSEDEVPMATLFHWGVYDGGAPNCIPCRDPCFSVHCGPDRYCVATRRNEPQCVCFPAGCGVPGGPARGPGPHGGAGGTGGAGGPVCGSDGRSYRSRCALVRARCLQKRVDLRVQYPGRCKRSCRTVHCPGSTSCVIDQSGAARCLPASAHLPLS